MDVGNLNDNECQCCDKTYKKMLEIAIISHAAARKKEGIKSKFSIEQMLLITIEY